MNIKLDNHHYCHHPQYKKPSINLPLSNMTTKCNEFNCPLALEVNKKSGFQRALSKWRNNWYKCPHRKRYPK